MYVQGFTRAADRPAVRRRNAHPGFSVGQEIFWGRVIERWAKTMGIDVILHAEFIFDIIFDRGRVEIDHLKMRFFTKGFLKDIRGFLRI